MVMALSPKTTPCSSEDIYRLEAAFELPFLNAVWKIAKSEQERNVCLSEMNNFWIDAQAKQLTIEQLRIAHALRTEEILPGSMSAMGTVKATALKGSVVKQTITRKGKAM